MLSPGEQQSVFLVTPKDMEIEQRLQRRPYQNIYVESHDHPSCGSAVNDSSIEASWSKLLVHELTQRRFAANRPAIPGGCGAQLTSGDSQLGKFRCVRLH